MLTAFTAGLLLITISELGDKTFFIAVILSLRHSRLLVFSAVVAALATMTILSVLLGQVVSLLPQIYLHYAEIALFFGFGLKLLYAASKMPVESNHQEEQEAAAAVKQAESQLKQKTTLGIFLEAFALTFVAEWGDRTQIATITLATSHQAFGVIIGAVLGHAICAAIAVTGGCLIARRVSERMITAIGGCLFLIFSFAAWWDGVGASTL